MTVNAGRVRFTGYATPVNRMPKASKNLVFTQV